MGRLSAGAALRAVAAVGMCALSLGLLGGCAGGQDMVTFPGESRQQGIKLYNESNYPDATAAFTTAIHQDPRDYQSYYYLGRSYAATHQYHQAVQAYHTALDVMAQSLAGREDTIFRQKVLDGMASAAAAGNSPELEQAAMQDRRQPTLEDAFVQAKIARIHGDVDSAVEAYSKASLLDPNNMYVAKEFGTYLTEIGQTQRAALQLKRAYVLNRRAGRTEDPEVVAGLRKIGIIPGPSLLEEKDLFKPPVPVGPLPAAEDVANGIKKTFQPEAGASTAGQ
jgi:cytochrome c-type biogenesis protein CcmH/NrfG